MQVYNELIDVLRRLRAPDGCPWDREQTHESLKAPVVEEAAEVLGAINLLKDTGDGDNLKEELGDLLLQVIMQALIAEEEGLFTMDDVMEGLREKMIRRHPHVFGEASASDSAEVLDLWEQVKAREKAGKDKAAPYLPEAFDEAEALIDRARARKKIRAGGQGHSSDA
ncbi:MAG: MazG family protein [Lachnospiraceae bacterium]|nr:MazG family protein [Lachnospiraceae bacterium]